MLSRVATSRSSLSRRAALLLLLAGATACAIPTWYGSPSAAEPKATEVEGVWKAVTAERVGKISKPYVPLQLTFAKDKVQYQTDSLLKEGVFELNPGATPATLDMDFGMSTMPTLYRVEGDKLTLAVGNGWINVKGINLPGNGKRPADFVSRPDDNRTILLTFERVKEVPAEDDAARMKRARLLAGGSLEKLAFAIWKYRDEHKSYPPAATTDGAGKPLLSWRVALLPYLGEKKLYDEFRQDEPWDSEHNRKLLPKMPKVYGTVGNRPKNPYGTFYQVFVGEGCLFETGKTITIEDVTDATLDTLAVIAAAEDVPWTKPADLTYAADKPLPSFIGGMLDDGLMSFATAGSGVHITSNALDEDLLRSLITRNDGKHPNVFITLKKLNPLAERERD